jgi:small subunit ribosomal protein S1
MAYQPVSPDDESLASSETGPSFGDILSDFEHGRQKPREEGAEGRDGVVVAVSPESVFVDIGLKTEGVLEASAFGAEPPKRGDSLRVSVTGRNPEGYYTLSRIKVARPKDWSSLEKAFVEKRVIAGVVSGTVKGGLSVDIGVRAFLPASRSGAKDAAELEKLVGQEITCRIIQLDVAEEDAVVDRRSVLEEEEKQARQRML